MLSAVSDRHQGDRLAIGRHPTAVILARAVQARHVVARRTVPFRVDGRITGIKTLAPGHVGHHEIRIQSVMPRGALGL